MKKNCVFSFGLLLIIYANISAQTIKVPTTLDSWDTIGGKPIPETYLGKECFLIQKGAIIARGANLRDGIIEADINFPQQRGFPGIIFRIENDINMENFYVRPHQSGNPDATQYTPIFNDYAGWQLYHGEGYSRAFNFKFDQWSRGGRCDGSSR